MKFTRWMGLTGLVLAVSVTASGPAVLADTVLADWEVAPNPGGATHVGEDFDPQLDTTISCSGCWYGRTIDSGPGNSFSQSTGVGATSGTHALQATIVGNGQNGGVGTYTPTINGAPVTLYTHFDYPLLVTYSNTPNPAAGGPDPRFTALKAAVDGNQGLFSIDFDITYDVAQMRSIPWQPPEETVDPVNNGQFPQRFFWIGMYGNSSAGPFRFLGQKNGVDPNSINPFDAQWDNNLLPVFHASFPLTDFGFVGGAGQTNFTLGILYNSVFGTLPAASNTTGAHFYLDNFRLVERDLIGPIDFNGNMMADLGDFQLFMAQHLVATPTLGDFDLDGDNDFLDFQQFEEFYDLATGGAGSLRAALAGVPEPGTFALAALAILGFAVARVRRWSRPLILLAVGVMIASEHQPAQAQVVETWTTLGKWIANPSAPAQAAPSIALGSIGATDGPTSLKITQADDTIGDNDFVWVTVTSPNWVAGDAPFETIRNAVNIGAEHYNVHVDVTFDPADLSDQGINSLNVTLGLNFNGETAATYAGETELFTTTATIPLSAFDLRDVEDEGVTGYSAQIGFTADGAGGFPFGVYVDNLRLEQISTPDLLTLDINRANGAATLKNLTANPISWDRMEIKSPGGTLDLMGWSSLDDQNADGANTWIEAGGSSATALVEQSLLGSHTLAPGGTLPLGNLWNEQMQIEDVDLEIRKAAGPSFRTYDQLVTYFGVAPPMGLAGDYNGDDKVDAADYTVWRDNLGAPTEASLNGNGDGMNGVDQADYTRWKSNFGAMAGPGAGGLSGNAVPEPSTLVLCALLAICAGRCTRAA